jgi:hypothetical protein
MGRSTVVLIWLALVALALRPIAPIERLARILFEPARQLARIAAPLSSGARVQAASEAEARARVRALLLAEQQGARPADPALLAGRGLVHAQVVDRSEEEKSDIVVVRYPLEAQIEPGMPVVCGDAYVGSVVEIGRMVPPAPERRTAPLPPGEARVRLVTAGAARVGARAGEVQLVAGGLARAEQRSEARRLLAVRALQCEPGAERELRVHEEPVAGGAWSALADGYQLGTLVPQKLGSRTLWAIEPRLDYAGGFSQMFVLCPPERSPAGALLAQDPFDERAWRPVRAALAGRFSRWRETLRLLSGSRAGLAEGAAIALGSEFVGRIAHADLWSCDVECLGDPGFRLLVLASLPGRSAPLQLGRVRSLGTDASGRVVYLGWNESAELARELGPEPRGAELYSASGERGVPPGLHLGHALLRANAGEQVLALERPGAADWGVALQAWIGERPLEQEP